MPTNTKLVVIAIYLLHRWGTSVRVPRIFVSIDIQKDDCINLEEAESRYITAVLRLKIKNEVILFNGTDYEYHGYIQEIQKKSVLISIKTQIKKNTDSPIKN